MNTYTKEYVSLTKITRKYANEHAVFTNTYTYTYAQYQFPNTWLSTHQWTNTYIQMNYLVSVVHLQFLDKLSQFFLDMPPKN